MKSRSVPERLTVRSASKPRTARTAPGLDATRAAICSTMGGLMDCHHPRETLVVHNRVLHRQTCRQKSQQLPRKINRARTSSLRTNVDAAACSGTARWKQIVAEAHATDVAATSPKTRTAHYIQKLEQRKRAKTAALRPVKRMSSALSRLIAPFMTLKLHTDLAPAPKARGKDRAT